ncbi:MAG: hypothetical protein GY839_07510 [candidate division Zixibacteria bacterium]|nr:hypothetical protein [candidate division Zixibacteria bacterium]
MRHQIGKVIHRKLKLGKLAAIIGIIIGCLLTGFFNLCSVILDNALKKPVLDSLELVNTEIIKYKPSLRDFKNFLPIQEKDNFVMIDKYARDEIIYTNDRWKDLTTEAVLIKIDEINNYPLLDVKFRNIGEHPVFIKGLMIEIIKYEPYVKPILKYYANIDCNNNLIFKVVNLISRPSQKVYLNNMNNNLLKYISKDSIDTKNDFNWIGSVSDSICTLILKKEYIDSECLTDFDYNTIGIYDSKRECTLDLDSIYVDVKYEGKSGFYQYERHQYNWYYRDTLIQHGELCFSNSGFHVATYAIGGAVPVSEEYSIIIDVLISKKNIDLEKVKGKNNIQEFSLSHEVVANSDDRIQVLLTSQEAGSFTVRACFYYNINEYIITEPFTFITYPPP